MKQLVSILFLFALALTAGAGLVSSNLLSLTTVSNTTTSGSSVILGSAYLPPTTFFVQNTGLTATTALRGNIQLSLDGTNFYTTGVYAPTSTNAAIDAFTLTNSAITIYVRFQAVTTNSVNVGASVVKQQ